MNILTKTFAPPPLNVQEIARYAGCRELTPTIEQTIRTCFAEVADRLRHTVVYAECPVTVKDGGVDFGAFFVPSGSLQKQLVGCRRAVWFAATVGLELARLITRYGITAPSKALLLQSIGAERIEALCNAFCAFLATDQTIRRRFSPGYGDCPLETQHDVFRLLDCPRKIGLTLNESLLMSPTKSVTAVVGLEG